MIASTSFGAFQAGSAGAAVPLTLQPTRALQRPGTPGVQGATAGAGSRASDGQTGTASPDRLLRRGSQLDILA